MNKEADRLDIISAYNYYLKDGMHIKNSTRRYIYMRTMQSFYVYELYIRGHKDEEIARLVGIKVKAVGEHIRKGRARTMTYIKLREVGRL